MRKDDDVANKMVDVHKSEKMPHKMGGGFGGLDTIIYQVISYVFLSFLSIIGHPAYQNNIVRMVWIILAIMYIFPRDNPAYENIA